MRLARPLVLLVALASLAAVLAACAAESTPGWTFSPTPTPTVAPSGEPGASGTPATPAPSGAPTAAPSDGGGGAVVQVTLTAEGIAFDTDTLEVPADTPFQIVFTNNDAGIPHNVAIREGSPTGPAVWTGEIFNGVETRTYDVPALPAGTYGFVCTVHPNMTGTLTAR
jgi:plastocyanin